MDEYGVKLLEYIFATEVLILANQLKLEYQAAGKPLEVDFVSLAIKTVNQKSGVIFKAMQQLG
jgi:hypothetical protein